MDEENPDNKKLLDTPSSSYARNPLVKLPRAKPGPRLLCGHNRNVVIGFIFTISNYAAQSVWGNSILAAFIYIATDKDTLKVGISEGLMGIGTVAVGLISGWISDTGKGGRSRTIVIGGLVNILAIAATAVAVLTDWNKFAMICTACTLWGIFSGITTAGVEAIFGDSIPSGSRQKIYFWRDGVGTAARAGGPMVAVGIFIALGTDDWEMSELRVVMMAGLGLALIPCTCCFMFDDSDTLGKESEAFNARGGGGKSGAESRSADIHRTVYDPVRGAATKADSSNGRTKHIPMIQFLSSLVMGIASGITSKYFPIYFIDEIHLGPILVNSVYALMPLTTSAVSYCVMRISYKVGRVQSVIFCMLIGIPLLYIMAAVPTSTWQSSGGAFIILVQVLRTSFMQAYSPVSRSVLNDYAPKSERARWNSLSSFQKVGWSGSAMVGGWLISQWNFAVCFWATATIQCIGLAIRFILLRMVPKDPVIESKKSSEGWRYVLAKESFVGEPGLNPETTTQTKGEENDDEDGEAFSRRSSLRTTDEDPQPTYWSTDDNLWDSVNSLFSTRSGESSLYNGYDNDLFE